MKARDLMITKCLLSDIKSFVENNHYSKNVNGVKISYCFKVTYNNKLIGAVIFGKMSTTAWKKFANNEKEVLELRRLVLLDEAERNSESRVIGYCLRWIKKNDKSVKIIVTYADPLYGHNGKIYQASNFQYIGKSGKDKGYYDFETGRIYHSRSLRVKYKGDYKPFAKKLREKRDKNLLKPIEIPAKHCYIYKLR